MGFLLFLIQPVIKMKWLKELFVSKRTQYWKGRSDGWFACEDMVISRIKQHYPDIADKLIKDLVQ